MLSRDTSREARKTQLAVYLRLGPSRRAELAYELSEQARAVAIEGMRARWPALAPGAAHDLLLRQLLGAELFEAAFGSSSA